ncbi:fluoride efflux transporter FluC [Corynebacterium mayonis]|uniref:fluoride efflux transporter FluC n=1 Tax=Corynebacterium mayonis TaxID=3062461 RepID=UPI0031409DFD
MMWSVFVVAVGGFLGGLARWALSFLNTNHRNAGTWAANVVGSAVLGFTIALPGVFPLFFGTGFAGALSTWSTLAAELGRDFKARRWRVVFVNAALSAATGVGAAAIGARYAARAFGV